MADWNDVHASWGVEAVREQLVAVVDAANDAAVVSLPCAPSLECGLPEGTATALTHTPGAVGGFRVSEQELLQDFVVVYGMDVAWDCKRARMIKLSAVREVVGRTRYKWWQESEHRRMAQDVVFDPTERSGDLILNLYDGFHTVPDARGCDGRNRSPARLDWGSGSPASGVCRAG